jgi:hypothetical protein
MRKSKTFQEGEDIIEVMSWVDNIIWAYSHCPNPRESGGEIYETSAKIKISLDITNNSGQPQNR